MQNSQDFQPVFPMERVPVEIFSVPLSEESRRLLSYGHRSELLENVQVEPGIVRDTKIKLAYDKKKNVKVVFEHKHPELKIPNELLGFKLDEHSKNLLAAGKTLGPLKYKGADIYVKVDRELNRIIVSTDKEIGIPNSIGKYQLSEIDKNCLVNGEPTPLRVLIDPEGNAFLASISLTQDKRGIIYNSLKEINKAHIPELMEQYNVDHKKLDPVPSMELEAIKALEGGQHVYYQIEQDNSIIKIESLDDLKNAMHRTGVTEFEISDRIIPEAIPYSSLQGGSAEINITETNPLSAEEQKIFDEVKKGNLAYLSQMEYSNVNPILIDKICKDREILDDTKISALALLGVKEPAKILEENKKIISASLHSNLEPELKIDKDLPAKKTPDGVTKVAQVVKGAENTANRLFSSM